MTNEPKGACVDLPELPEPASAIALAAWGAKPDYYTAEQMRAYAIAALSAGGAQEAVRVTEEMIERGAKAFWGIAPRGVSWEDADACRAEWMHVSRVVLTGALGVIRAAGSEGEELDREAEIARRIGRLSKPRDHEKHTPTGEAIVVWEKHGNCLWHVNCEAGPVTGRGIWRKERTEEERTLLKCVACGVSVYARHGLADGMRYSFPIIPTPIGDPNKMGGGVIERDPRYFINGLPTVAANLRSEGQTSRAELVESACRMIRKLSTPTERTPQRGGELVTALLDEARLHHGSSTADDLARLLREAAAALSATARSSGALEGAYDQGWRECVVWVRDRDDLLADMDSPAYLKYRAARLAALHPATERKGE